MSKKLDGKVAVITGGSNGIGFATAELFVKEGAFVFITGRREKELRSAVKKLGKRARGVAGDVSKMRDLDKLYAAVKREKKKIDILFANAGVYSFCPLESITEEYFDQMCDINIKGLLFTVQKSLPLFKNGGSIILNASVAASTGMEGLSVYCATKAAVRSFARNFCLDLKSRKIRVNAISPGVIPTEGFRVFGKKNEIDAFVKGIVPEIPSERAGKPIEIAQGVLFLASDESSYVNGTELFVDGGLAQV